VCVRRQMSVRFHGGREPLDGQLIRETHAVRASDDVLQGVLELTRLVPSVSSPWRRWLAMSILRHRGPHVWFKKALIAAGMPFLTLRQIATWYSHLGRSLYLPADVQHAESLLKAAVYEISHSNTNAVAFPKTPRDASPPHRRSRGHR